MRVAPQTDPMEANAHVPDPVLKVLYPNEDADWIPVVKRDLKTHGWLVHHIFGGKGQDAGFPDVVAVHERTGRLLVAELKTERGKVTESQARWLRAFAADPLAGVYVLRPSDHHELLDVIEEEIRRQQLRDESPELVIAAPCGPRYSRGGRRENDPGIRSA